jgi:hypothetical protein
MSQIPALLKELASHGVTLKRDGDQLELDGPWVVLTDALVAKLRARKSDILRILGKTDAANWAMPARSLKNACQSESGVSGAEALCTDEHGNSLARTQSWAAG